MKNNWIEAVEVLEKEPSLYSYMRHCPLDVLKNLQVKHYPADRFFLKQGEYYDNIYFVVRGELEIFVSSNQGKKYRQATYTKGDFLGEMEAFGQFPFISSVCALTDIELLVLPREDYLHWLEADRVFADHILKKICRDYYTISVMSANNLLHGLKQRICHYLYKNMVEEKGPPPCQMVRITSEELSEKLAVTQRSVNRVLKDLKEDEIISVSKRSIAILNWQALQEEYTTME